MKILNGRPPNYDEIDAAFHIRGKTVIFAWGNIIYNPSGVSIPEHLIAHEAVHGERQLNISAFTMPEERIKLWWREYIRDPKFRAEEELHAHRAEYLHRMREGNRQHRRRALLVTAKRLAAPLYGKVFTVAKAKRALNYGWDD